MNEQARTPLPRATPSDAGNIESGRALVKRLGSLPKSKYSSLFDVDVLKEYKFEYYLGHGILFLNLTGSYGHVCQATKIDEDREVAIKRIDNVFHNSVYGTFLCQQIAKRILREIQILRLLKKSPQVVTLLDVIPDKLHPKPFTTLFCVFEFVPTDLAKLFHTRQFFKELHVQYITYQLLVGLKWIHSAHVIHRDLKPANILIDTKCSIRICDFGLARGLESDVDKNDEVLSIAGYDVEKKENEVVSPNDGLSQPKLRRQLTIHVATRWYRAPELILLAKKYNEKIDVWSVGCILSELMQMQEANCSKVQNRRPLFPGASCFPLSSGEVSKLRGAQDQLAVIFKVIGSPSESDIKESCSEKAQKYLETLPHRKPQSFEEILPGSSKQGIDLLKKMLMFNPSKRISIEKALSHPYFERVRQPELEKAHEVVKFSFENISLGTEAIRSLIVDELGLYTKHRSLKMRSRSFEELSQGISEDLERARASISEESEEEEDPLHYL